MALALIGGDAHRARVVLKAVMAQMQVIQDGERTRVDGAIVVKAEGSDATDAAGISDGAGLSVMVTAADQLTSLLLSDRLAEQELTVTEVGLADMVEESRSGRFDAVIAVPPVSLLDYTEGRWHDALVGVDASLPLTILASPRVPVRAVAGVRRAAGGLALLDSSSPTSVWTVIASIRLAVTGRHTIDSVFTEQRGSSVLGGFSPAERLVYELLACGCSNRAIAEQLFLSERTVETHVRQIFMRLGLSEDPATNRRVLAARLALDGTAQVSSNRAR